VREPGNLLAVDSWELADPRGHGCYEDFSTMRLRKMTIVLAFERPRPTQKKITLWVQAF
jgi:hypothetical protein